MLLSRWPPLRGGGPRTECAKPRFF